jgi:CelD/BcsL family acetyltransferase involved in cellulose biosynthesis
VKVRIVNSLREFDALAPIWREVTEAGGQTSPFLHHDWFACCWRTAGPDRRREAWLIEDGAGPVGIVPFLRSRARVGGLPVRVLRYMDVPDTPLADIPAAHEVDAVVQTFLATLRAGRDWDLLVLPHLPVGSRTLKTLAAALPGQFRWRVASTTHLSSLRFTGSSEVGEAPWLRTSTLSSEREILDDKFLVEEHRKVDPRGAVFREVMELFEHSWKRPDAFSVSRLHGRPRFFHELTERASSNGWLHLWILRLDGRAIATEYQLGANGHRHALRNYSDPARADLAPGRRLNREILQTLRAQQDVHEYTVGLASDLAGPCAGGSAHETVTLHVYGPTPTGRLLASLEGLGRRWRTRAGSQ